LSIVKLGVRDPRDAEAGRPVRYDVKRPVASTIRHFWAISDVQIYPELKRLEEHGLVLGRDGESSSRGRPRRV